MSEQPEKVFFNPSNPEKFFLIGSKLSPTDREQLLQILIDNQDVFAWWSMMLRVYLQPWRVIH